MHMYVLQPKKTTRNLINVNINKILRLIAYEEPKRGHHLLLKGFFVVFPYLGYACYESEVFFFLFHFQRIRHYMDWSVNSIQYLAMKEVHSTFLECFLKTAANFNKQDDGKRSVKCFCAYVPKR